MPELPGLPATPAASGRTPSPRDPHERDDLLAIAAHDLRNPLHALTLQLTLARNAALSSGHADTVARIEKAQAMLARYVDRATLLLDLLRVDAGAYPLSLRDIDLAALIRTIADGLMQEAGFHGVRLEAIAPQSLVAHVDPLAIEQIVDNLILNALKHAACRHVRVVLDVDGDDAKIQVIDDGRGIEACDQELVFAKFRIAQNGPRGHGTGLGLWIVRQLSASLGGRVDLDSEPGRGCRFTLRFPLIVRNTP